jgi:hypothetical protein
MRIEIAHVAPDLVQQRQQAYLQDASLPLTVRGMINVHLTKAWIPNFWTVAIRAPKPGSEIYFDFPIGFAEDETSWFFPSRQWWIAHANASHPPAGVGCDAEVHAKFLTNTGASHEFDYATVFLDGRIDVLGREAFVEECTWWQRAFGDAPKDDVP